MTAHHLGDQYETILMRLAMAGSSFHVREISQAPRSLNHFAKESLRCGWSVPSPKSVECFGVLGIPNLRISLRRPLLNFSKERLIATCHAANIPWVEDESNADRKLTPRNAVRHIVRKHALPGALSQSSLLEMARHVGRRTAAVHSISKKILQGTDLKLDVRTGSVVATLPTLETVETMLHVSGFPSLQPSTATLSWVIGTYLRSIASLVSHKDEAHQAVYSGKLSHLFGSPKELKSFTFSHALFEPLSNNRWIASSQPMRANGLHKTRLEHACIRYPYVLSPDQSRYKDFDGRWWVRVENPSDDTTLALRYMYLEDLRSLLQRLKSGEIHIRDVNDPLGSPRNLNTILDSLGPYRLRWWLPIIVQRSSDFDTYLQRLSPLEQLLEASNPRTPGAESIVAFPTLNLRIGGNENAVPRWVKDLKWEMYYKSLDDFEDRLENMIVLPTTKESKGLVG
ncbi:hypothetical protein, variant [Verruconis gallopava]|nr:hypothetical protein, variant [Verruconis gallopava]KIW01305.1 hypothetical protein, variant [Verruconis gallopava]